MKTPLLAAALLALLSTAPLAAPCTIDQPAWTNFGGASPPEGMGQSFTACQTGWVTSVTVFVALTPPAGPVDLQVQPGTAIHPQTAPQSVSLVSGLNTIVLDDPVPVTAGGVYSWGLMPTVDALWLRYNQGDVYPDGLQVHWNGVSLGEFPTLDFEFAVEITDDGSVGNEDWDLGALKSRYR